MDNNTCKSKNIGSLFSDIATTPTLIIRKLTRATTASIIRQVLLDDREAITLVMKNVKTGEEYSKAIHIGCSMALPVEPSPHPDQLAINARNPNKGIKIKSPETPKNIAIFLCGESKRLGNRLVLSRDIVFLAERPRTSIADKGRVFGLVDGCSCHKA